MAIARAGTIHGHPIDPSAVFVVGDTPRDVRAAEDAGAVSVAVATGHFSYDELEAAGADHVLPTLEAPFPQLTSRRN
jgi:phosphoglycolate phosphatase